MTGRNRDPNIQRAERFCVKHSAVTEHSRYERSGHGNPQWRCNPCMAEYNQNYREQVRQGEIVPQPRSVVLEPTQGASCTGCWIELGANEGTPVGTSGLLCDECV